MRSIKICWVRNFLFYNRKGLDEVLEKSRLEKVEKSVITNNLVNVKHTNLYYMPPSAKTDLELEESLDEHFIHMFFSGMKHFKSLNFIDGINGTGEISETLLRNSDLIVVNLYQGMGWNRRNSGKSVGAGKRNFYRGKI